MIPTINGFENLEEVGRGGFGVVYRADDKAHGRTVAIKVLRNVVDPSAQARFERECRAAGSLSSHPNIVAIFGSGTTDSGDPYIVMDYLSGGSLAQRVRESGPLGTEDAIKLGVGIAGALQAAHQAGTIHRDVKPENIIYSRFGVAQLVDFGIARMSSEFETRSGSITASLSHAPPEVLSGDNATERSDIYSLASVLHFALCGSAPFDEGEGSLAALIARIATSPPPALTGFGVPAELSEAVAKGLAKDPLDRPASAQDFAESLQATADSLELDVPAFASSAAPPSRRRLLLAGVAAVLAIGLGGSIWAFANSDSPQEVMTGTAPTAPSLVPPASTSTTSTSAPTSTTSTTAASASATTTSVSISPLPTSPTQTSPKQTIPTRSSATTTTALRPRPTITVPSAPRSVAASNPTGNSSSVSVQISWTAPSSTGGAISGYRIRSQIWKLSHTASGCTGIPTAAGGQTEASVGPVGSARRSTSTAPACSWVSWQVAAFNSAGTGPWSQASGIMPDVKGRPDAYHLVRSIGAMAISGGETNCGTSPYTGCATNPGAGSKIAAGRTTTVSLQAE